MVVNERPPKGEGELLGINSIGSGVSVGAGLVVTNAHVAHEAVGSSSTAPTIVLTAT